MKKCTYCGIELPDEAEVCPIDESPLIDSEATKCPPPTTEREGNGRGNRDGSVQTSALPLTDKRGSFRSILLLGFCCLVGIGIAAINHSPLDKRSITSSPNITNHQTAQTQTRHVTPAEEIVDRIIETDSTFYQSAGFLDFKFGTPPRQLAVPRYDDFSGEVDANFQNPPGQNTQKTRLFFVNGKLKAITKYYYGQPEGYLEEVKNTFGTVAPSNIARFDLHDNRGALDEQLVMRYSCPNVFVLVWVSRGRVALTVIEKAFLREALLTNLTETAVTFGALGKTIPLLADPEKWPEIRLPDRIYAYGKCEGYPGLGQPSAAIKASLAQSMVYSIVHFDSHRLGGLIERESQPRRFDQMNVQNLYPIPIRRVFYEAQAELAQTYFPPATEINVNKEESDLEPGVSLISWTTADGWHVARFYNSDFHFYLPLVVKRKL